MMQLNKSKLVLIGVILIGAYLRLYRLPELMPFIGDQGWFYISARDIILTGNIPLVGITSSHTWLHQGALWTYTLVPLLKLFNFNPIVPAYFTALLGIITIALVYKLAREMFNEHIALVSSFLFATSPLIIIDSRMAYHTGPIPFFTTLLLLSVYRWTNGKIQYFPLIIFLLAILYNFEIATFSLIGIVVLIFVYGLLKKQKLVLKLFNKKTMTFSFIGFIIPMIPMFLYDINHGFPQTVKVVIWIFYRIAVFLGYSPLNQNATGENWNTFFPFAFDLIRKLIFLPSTSFSILLFLSSLVFLILNVYKNYKSKKNESSSVLILLSVIIPALAYAAAKTNSSAYVLIFYPQLMIMIAFLINHFLRNKLLTFGFGLFLLIFGFINSNFLIGQNYLTGPSFTKRIEASKKIIKEANGRPYNVLGKGEGSQFESFIMTHEYLVWWQGHGPSKKNEKLKFYVSEYIDRIEVERK